MKHILIVDDSPVMRRNLRTILTKNGYHVIAEAANGEEALRLYEKHKPDLVTMDITMPVLNGIEAVKRLIEADAAAKIIVISAFDQRNMLFDAIENGAKRYIIKPITEPKLLQALQETFQESDDSRDFPALTNRSTEIASDHPSSQTGDSLSIDNKDGRFHIRLPLIPLSTDLDALRTAISGLLFIKPLFISIHIPSSVLTLETADTLCEAAAKINAAGGSLRFLAMHHETAGTLQARIPGADIGVIGG